MLKYHLIWIPRRRRKVLVRSRRAQALKRCSARKPKSFPSRLSILPSGPTTCMFVNAPPSLAVSQLVYRFKRGTRRGCFDKFAHLRKMPSMWTTAYFATTAGRVSEATIHNYIEAQRRGLRMKLRKVYRFRMRPTKTEEVGQHRMAGARRFVYNWALSRRKGYTPKGKGISARELSSELRARSRVSLRPSGSKRPTRRCSSGSTERG